jgi:diaminohydroxyphosphoribosylaminopyrimidine deaminase/5-amino-6-(5-phosphoribosylamino)uracil reductase
VPTWVLTSDEAGQPVAGRLRAAGVLVVPVAPTAPLDICEALGALADEGITRLLVEGGPQIWRAFSDAGVIDEVVVYQAQGPGSDARSGASAFINLDGLSRISELKLAEDRVTVFRAKR